MADQDARALLLTIQANTELLRSNLSAAEKAIESFTSTTQQHLDQTDARFEAFGKGLEKLEGPLERLKGLGEFALGAVLGESLIETGKKALEFAGNVQFVSEQVGTSTKFLQEYRYAAGQFGVGTADADEGLNKFARSIGQAANGNKTLIELFNRLGVNVRDAGGNVRSVEAVFNDTANAIAKIDNPAQKSADTLSLMGKGASGLIPLLSSGAAGFATLAKAAEQLGVVLSPELIEHSEAVNHQLAALKQVLSAQMAAAIDSNAGSIEVLAGTVVKLAGAFAKLNQEHPGTTLALVGAAAGARLGGALGPGGGLAGAAIGGAAGYVYGQRQAQDEDDRNTDLSFRQRTLFTARDKVANDQRVRTASNGNLIANSDYSADITELRRQLALYHNAQKAPHVAEGGLGSDDVGTTNDNGDDLKNAEKRLSDLEVQKAKASGAALTAIEQEIVQQKRKIGFIKQGADAELAGSLATRQGAVEKSGESAAKEAARKAEELRQKNLTDDIAYAGEVRKLREQILSGMRKTATNDAASDALQKEGINADAVTATAQNRLKFDKGDFGTDPKVAQARLDNLNGLVEQNRVQQLANVDINRQSQTVAQTLAVAQQDLQNRTALLQIQDSLATTAAERRKLELQLLDIQQQQVRLALQKVLDDTKASDAEKALAQKQKDALPPIEAAQRAQVINSTQGPAAQYVRSLNPTPGERNELIQTQEVGLLQDFNKGLDDTITKALHVHGIFGEIIDDIVDMIVKQALIRPLANALFPGGASAGGGGGGLFGGILGGLGRIFGGGGGGNQFAGVDAQAEAGITGYLSAFHLAGGGPVAGPGSSRSDSIPAMLSNGEFVITADQAAKHLPLLHAINDNKVARFADGGLVGARAVIPPPAPDLRQIGADRAAAIASRITVEVKANDYFDARVSSIAGSQIQAAAPHIAAGGATLAATRAARQRSRTLPG